MEVAEHDPERKSDRRTDAERGPGKLELLECLVRKEAGVVADEPERFDERVHVGGIGDHAFARVQGTSARRAATRTKSQVSASATTRKPAE